MTSLILTGPNAFYNQPNYLENLFKEGLNEGLLPTIYSCNSPEWDAANTESKVITFARYFFSIVIFPIAIYQILRAAYHLIHGLIGKIVLPSSNVFYMDLRAERNRLRIYRTACFEDSVEKIKRFTVDFDGYKLDVMIVGTKKTFESGRWTLASVGSGMHYEGLASDDDFRKNLAKTNSSGIFFNYPSVGRSSSSLPNKEAMIKSYQVMLKFLENGLQAKEIIGYGFSIGGDTQEALESYPLKDGVKYLFIKDKAPSSIAAVVDWIAFGILGFLVRISGWDINSIKASKNLKAREIIFQAANVGPITKLTDSKSLMFDDVIPVNASIAKAILDDPDCPKKDKLIIGAYQTHREPAYFLYDFSKIVVEGIDPHDMCVDIYDLESGNEKVARELYDDLKPEVKKRVCVAIGKKHWNGEYHTDDQDAHYETAGRDLKSSNLKRYLIPELIIELQRKDRSIFIKRATPTYFT